MIYFILYSHALAESDQSQIYHEYDQTKESKQSISRQVSSNEPKYAAAFKPADDTPSNEQYQVPLVEYAKVDKSKKNTSQQNSVPSGCEVNGSIVTANKEVSAQYKFSCMQIRIRILTYIWTYRILGNFQGKNF